MQLFYAPVERLTVQPTVLTIGKFDGVHLGHQLLILTAVQRARQQDFASAVITFEPHPRTVLNPDVPVELLTSISERATLIAELGADLLIVLPFSHATMSTPALDYMRQLCQLMPLRELWVGADFALGRQREGTVPRLREIGRELGYTVDTVLPVVVDGQVVSASRIRAMLQTGNLAGVRAFLGRDYWLRGKVTHGDQRGRTIGFPTANLELDTNHIVPAYGVYACRVLIEDGQHASPHPLPAVTNVGVRPTVDGRQRRLEAHLLDWSGDLYGATLRLSFLHRLRGERKFSGLPELVAQIERDAAQARQVLAGGG